MLAVVVVDDEGQSHKVPVTDPRNVRSVRGRYRSCEPQLPLQEKLVGWKTITEGSEHLGEKRIRVPVFEPATRVQSKVQASSLDGWLQLCQHPKLLCVYKQPPSRHLQPFRVSRTRKVRFVLHLILLYIKHECFPFCPRDYAYYRCHDIAYGHRYFRCVMVCICQ